MHSVKKILSGLLMAMKENEEVERARGQLKERIEQAKKGFLDVLDCRNAHHQYFVRSLLPKISTHPVIGQETIIQAEQEIISGDESIYRFIITTTWQYWEVFEQVKYKDLPLKLKGEELVNKRKELGIYLFSLIRNCILHYDGDVEKYKSNDSKKYAREQGEALSKEKKYLTKNGNLRIDKDGLERLLGRMNDAIEKSKII